IRIEGRVTAATEAESDAYFATRGRQSQLSAWASRQSQPLGSRQELEDRQTAMEDRYAEGDVPRPPYWHGYRVEPRRIEFWSDGAHRLHHRRLFTRTEGGWSEQLLYP
ncbi:MAG: pyridoxal 5'-phosphate synthase, partial [Pseudomonadota bacterium]|nr:pyridoxal 5'-phosphate synthase [Pseudomonadota bacterium]